MNDVSKLTEASAYDDDNRTSSDSYSSSVSYRDDRNATRRFIDSFKPADFEYDENIDISLLTDLEKAVYLTSKSPLSRRLKNRHIQMIAIGGSIGTGLFVGNGYALSSAGPAGLVISYAIVSFAIYMVMIALGEMASQFPVAGAFNTYFTRFIDDSFGFTMGILYACSWLISFPSELIACAITIQYWTTSVNPAVWVAVFWVITSSINLFGIKGYGEVEFVLSFIKVIFVIVFIIAGICIICGAGDQGYIGGKYWHDPGAFANGFKGVCNGFITASFSLGGIELSCLVAAETQNVRKSIPKAVKTVFYRLTIFYFVSSVVISCLVPYNDVRLLSGNSSEDINSSPFVIAIQNGGIKVLPHIMNAVILLAVVSVGSSSVYGCSRTVAALAAQGLIPRIFGYIDREGRPLVGIMVTNIFGLLGFLVVNENQGTVFTWFFSVCSLSAFFTWFTICLSHVRFRLALYEQNRSADELIFPSPLGIYGSYIGMFLFFLIICAELYISIFPLGASPNAEGFFQYCLSLPLMLVMWAGHKTFRRSWGRLYVKLKDIDLDTGRREVDIDVLKQELAEERLALSQKPFYFKLYHIFC